MSKIVLSWFDTEAEAAANFLCVGFHGFLVHEHLEHIHVRRNSVRCRVGSTMPRRGSRLSRALRH